MTGTLDQIIEDCNLFISAAQTQMSTLDEDGGLLEGTRVDLLENRGTLTVPDGNPRGIAGFDQLVELLEAGNVMPAQATATCRWGSIPGRFSPVTAWTRRPWPLRAC